MNVGRYTTGCPDNNKKETKLKIFSISFAIFIVKQFFHSWSRGKRWKISFVFIYKLFVFISEMRKLFFNVPFEVVNLLCGRQRKPTHGLTGWRIYRPLQKLISITSTNCFTTNKFVDFCQRNRESMIWQRNIVKIHSPIAAGTVVTSGQSLSSEPSSQSAIWSHRFVSGTQRVVSHENSPIPHSVWWRKKFI